MKRWISIECILVGGRAAAILALLLWAVPSQAADWRWGEVTASLDSSLTFSTSFRTQGRDCRLFATINGGCNSDGTLFTQGRLVNGDDGNLNYDKGQLFSALAQATHDVQVEWRNFGAFVRFTYFGDLAQGPAGYPERTRLSNDARFRSSLLQSGVVGAHFYFLDAYAYASFELLDRFFDVRVGNQVLNWGESVFTQGGVNTISTLDVTKIRLAGSELRDALLPAPIVRLSTTLFEQLSVEAYYQFAWRKTLIDPVGTFFSTSDLVSRGAVAQYSNFLGCGDAGTSPSDRGPLCPSDDDLLNTFPFAFPLVGREDARDQGQWGAALRYYLDQIETEFAVYYIRLHDKFPTVSYRGTALSLQLPPNGPCQGTPGGAPKPGCDAGYIVEYKNNIDLYGFSLTTVIADVAYGFEFSYRRNQPTPLNTGDAVQQFTLDLAATPGVPRKVDGASREDRLVAIANMLYVFGPGNRFGGLLVNLLGASDMNFVAEAALTHYPRLSRPRSAYVGPLGVQRVDRTGGGYQLRLAANYERFLGMPFSVSPAIAFRHDISGITPAGEAAFNEDLMQVGLSLELNYLERWKAIVSYSNSFSAGQRNESNDRDFLGLSISYAL